MGDYPVALEYNFKALEIFDKLGEKNGQALISGNIGEIYLVLAKDTTGSTNPGKFIPSGKQEVLGLAIQYLRKGASICRDISILGGVIEFSRNLATAYTIAGRYKEALQCSREYTTTQDSLYSRENIQKIALLETKKDKEIKEKEIEVQRLQLLAGRNEKRYYIAGLSLLLMLSGGLYRRARTTRKTRKKLEDKNRQIAAEKEHADMLRARAERSEQFKQQFLANMSHEIRTPMNAVSGMTDLLLEKKPRPDQLHFLRVISRSSDILLHIIDDILDLSKLEAGKLELEAIDFSLEDTIRHVRETLSFRAEEKGIHLTTSIDSNIPDVLIGDPFRLNQVLLNLAGNARKFTEKGTVEINVVLLKSEAQHFSLLFKVVDTGIGIPADKLQSIFDSFRQAQSSDSRVYGGTGLGLSIAKQLVELHGGTIAVVSDVGRGSAFSFKLSFPEGSARKLAQKAREEQNADGSILNGLRILLVDDNEYNRMVALETVRAKADVAIAEATNGQEAIDLLRKNDYDVVLMDIQMPVMNGLDATRYIRSKMPAPKNKIPIIALTASLLRGDMNMCLAAGMDGYLPKPFKSWQLISALAVATGRKITVPETVEDMETALLADEEIAGSQSGITDLSYLEGFCEGDRERMKKFIRVYIGSIPVFKGRMKAAIESNNKEEIATLVHTFKPRWRMMGMKQSNDLAVKIETQIKELDDGLAASVALLVDQVERSVNEIAEEIKKS